MCTLPPCHYTSIVYNAALSCCINYIYLSKILDSTGESTVAEENTRTMRLILYVCAAMSAVGWFVYNLALKSTAVLWCSSQCRKMRYIITYDKKSTTIKNIIRITFIKSSVSIDRRKPHDIVDTGSNIPNTTLNTQPLFWSQSSAGGKVINTDRTTT